MRKLRFSDAVFATEASPKALRKMLQSGKLLMPSPAREGWSEFSPLQLTVLVVSRRLVDFGIQVEFASQLTCLALCAALSSADNKSDDLSARDFLQRLLHHYIMVLVDPKGGALSYEIVESDNWPLVNDAIAHRPALTLPLHAIVSRCFERAPILSDDDMSGCERALNEALEECEITFRAISIHGGGGPAQVVRKDAA